MDFETIAALICFAALIIVWALAPAGTELFAEEPRRVPATS